MSSGAKGRLQGRIALVTGASRGIGAAVAKRYGAEGAHVILVARTVGGLEESDDAIRAAGGSATLVPLDLTESVKIDELGARLYERFGKLDVLVGNAGMLGALTPLTHLDPPVWDEVMAVNLTANWRLLRSMDPLLRRSDAGRAIFVTSGAARGIFPFWGAYAVSKAALEMLVRTYAAEVSEFGVRANIVDPGVVRTAMRAAAFPGEDPLKLPAPEAITEAFVTLAEPSCRQNGQIVRA
ncbi:MAG TPA: SDR family NAD(P)-dependent oxidoreductase [Alphaproteobacteria bacterium]